MNCHISNQIADYCNQEDSLTASEIFSQLREAGTAYINGEEVSFYQITDSIDVEELREAAQESLTGNGCALYELYIKTIGEW